MLKRSMMTDRERTVSGGNRDNLKRTLCSSLWQSDYRESYSPGLECPQDWHAGKGIDWSQVLARGGTCPPGKISHSSEYLSGHFCKEDWSPDKDGWWDKWWAGPHRDWPGLLSHLPLAFYFNLNLMSVERGSLSICIPLPNLAILIKSPISALHDCLSV